MTVEYDLKELMQDAAAAIEPEMQPQFVPEHKLYEKAQALSFAWLLEQKPEMPEEVAQAISIQVARSYGKEVTDGGEA